VTTDMDNRIFVKTTRYAERDFLIFFAMIRISLLACYISYLYRCAKITL